MSTRQGPLSGIRVIEIDAIGPVPLAGMLLADQGAEVVRVARAASAGASVWSDVGGGILHRSRNVVHLNLKNESDRTKLLDLVGFADVLVEGFRPGVMERLGLGPDTCLARNPRLVYGRMTGWGQSGPLSQRAGHDLNYLAITGALHAMGRKDGPPAVPLNLVGDYAGGAMFLVFGLLAAVLAAKTTGKGSVVDACITDSVPSLMSLFYAWLPTGAWRDQPQENLLDGAAPFYRCYRCADGRDVAVGCLEPQFFAELLKGLGLEQRGYEQNDRKGWPGMAADFAGVFAQRTRDEWAALFADTDACVTPVLSMTEAPEHPHNQAREAFLRRRGVVEPAPAPRTNTPLPAPDDCLDVSIDAMLSRWQHR